MSIKVADNFLYQGRKPLDNRILIDTVANMVAMADAIIYDGMIAYVQADKKFYVYDSTNTVDSVLAKWRELKTGGTGNASVLEYAKNTDYKKDTLVYDGNELARVKADFKSDNTAGNTTTQSFELDITNNNLILIPTEIKFNQLNNEISDYIGGQIFTNVSTITNYKQAITIADTDVFLYNGSQLTNDQKKNAKLIQIIDASKNLVGIAIIKSYNANQFTIYALEYNPKVSGTFKTYKSAVTINTTIDTQTTLQLTDLPTGTLITDIEVNHLVYDTKGTVAKVDSINTLTNEVIVTTITNAIEYMPKAPDTKEFTVVNAGTGYTVGDIIETTTSGIFGEVNNIGPNGEIVSLQMTTQTTQSVTGTGATIDYSQTIYGGFGNQWAALSNAAVLVAETVADKFEYLQGYSFSINNAGTGYTVGDVIGTDDPNVFVEVKVVDTNGEILEVKYVRNNTINTTGTGASITTTPNPDMFIIPDTIWNIGMSVFSITNDAGAMTEFYRNGDKTIKYNAGPDNKIYKFEYDEINGVIYQSTYQISGGNPIIYSATLPINATIMQKNTLYVNDTGFTFTPDGSQLVYHQQIVKFVTSLPTTGLQDNLYVNLSDNSIQYYDSSLSQWVKLGGGSTIEFNTKSNFPSLGNNTTLYVATDENKIYRYDITNGKYIDLTSGGTGKQYSTTIIGNNTNSIFTINHNMNTKKLVTSVYDSSTGEAVVFEQKIIDNDNIEISWGLPIPTGTTYQVDILGW